MTKTATGAAEGPNPLGGQAAFLLARLGRLARNLLRSQMDGPGMRPPFLRVLSALAAEDGRSQRELVEALGIDRSTMVRLIDALEAQGFAERRPHATDRRAYSVHITPAGRRAADKLSAAAELANRTLLEPLRDADKATFERLLEALQTGHAERLTKLPKRERSRRTGVKKHERRRHRRHDRRDRPDS